ncbi:MAG: TIGR01777 family protein [Candidatus Rokubacteria bacterium RIFCSPLOWO2_02_FULL_72_37]|nr:MAG: TIGR01777 family protein [Candidatus Rokubacteria bacterium RIFCSPLOWO2_02_FULL_72_37]
MIVAVTGASGLVGSALRRALAAQGHDVLPLVRGAAPAPGERVVRWDPAAGTLAAADLEGVDAVVHLAGERIAGRWTAAKKARIRDSRVRSTALLAGTLARLARPPRVLVSASAVGWYGDRGDEILTEGSPPGTGFLAEVCREWEAATGPAALVGIRVAHLRIGMVLSRRGGGLAALLPAFRLGLGGAVGRGVQWMSWIALDDLVGALVHALGADTLAGPVNAVAPHPVTNREFTRTLGRVLRRPAFLPFPALAARLLLGEMANALLLASVRALPLRLTASGYAFEHPQLDGALRAELAR